jgi:hypothetical protein
MAFFLFSLWLGTAMLVGLAWGITGSPIGTGVAAMILIVPALFLTWRIALLCVEAECQWL